MSPHTETFYYSSHSKEEAVKLINSNNPGHTLKGILSLYHDEQLTKKAGNLFYNIILLDNRKNPPLVYAEDIISTNKGTIKYKSIRDSYKVKTMETEETSGLYKKGIITRFYITPDKSIRKLVYKPL